MPSDSQDRAAGALIGLAAGDKNHGPSEMAWRLASSLAELQHFDPEDVFARYLEWHRQGSYDTGTVAQIVFDQAVAGVERKEAAARAHEQLEGITAGVNPAHRVAPLALATFLSDDDLEAAARSEVALTHAHPLAGDTAAAVATLCRQLIRGTSWEEALAAASTDKLPEVVAALQPDQTAADQLSRGGFAPKTLEAAIWHLNQARNFEEALTSSLEFAGPANYCPVLVGVIGGARWGAEAVPEEQQLGHALLPQIRVVAKSLAFSW